MYDKYDLVLDEDFYQHKHYTIVTRQGIEKIQAKESIEISYDVVTASDDYCLVKATAEKEGRFVQSLGSAKYGGKEYVEGKWVDKGTTTNWYIAEIAEKRSMSRVVLKMLGFYQYSVFGQDESESFKRNE